jgi:hypothetical protein
MLDADRFYVRQRGRIRGPFDAEQLRALRAAGQITPIDEISIDRVTWQSLDAVASPAESVPPPAPAVGPRSAATDAKRSAPRPVSAVRRAPAATGSAPGLTLTPLALGSLLLLAIHLPRDVSGAALRWWWLPGDMPGSWAVTAALAATLVIALGLLVTPLWPVARRGIVVFVSGLLGVVTLTAGVLLAPQASLLLGHVDLTAETVAGRLGVLRAAVAATLLGTYMSLVVVGALALPRTTAQPIVEVRP